MSHLAALRKWSSGAGFNPCVHFEGQSCATSSCRLQDRWIAPGESMRTHVRNGLVLTLDEQEHLYDRADLVIEGGVITQLGPGVALSAGEADRVT